MSSKQKRHDRIVDLCATEPRRWSFLIDKLDVSEATLSRDLKELQEKDVLVKWLDESRDQVYSAFNIDKEELKDSFKRRKRLNSALKDRGILSDGFNFEEVPEFVEENKDDIISLVGKNNLPQDNSIDEIRTFLSILNSIMPGKLGGKFTIERERPEELEMSWEEYLEEHKQTVKNFDKEMYEYEN